MSALPQPTPRIAPLGSLAPLGRRASVPGETAPSPLAPLAGAGTGSSISDVPHAFQIDLLNTGTRRTLDEIEAGSSEAFLPTGPDFQVVSGGASRSFKSVRDVQQVLSQQGFYTGPVDGQPSRAYTRAVRHFQAARGLGADGIVGPETRAALGAGSTNDGVMPATPAPSQASGLQKRLNGNLHNRYKGRVHQCFRYAWATATGAGGRGIGSASQSYAGRNAGVAHLNTLISQGKVKVGDVIYANRKPGADPSSRNLKFGPHWFVYLGNGRFADQYGVRDANAMAAFVPGRKIDTIYHPFDTRMA